MSYQVPLYINKDKIFIVNRSEIEERLDAQYYKASVNIPNGVKLSNFALVKGGKRIPKGYSYSNAETPYYYLRVADMDSDSDINYEKLRCIDENVYNILEKYEIKEELAISIAGTIGKVCIVRDIPLGHKVILTENCAKILIRKEAGLQLEYLKVLFSMTFIQKQLQLNYIQTTIPKLGLDRILNLKFPPIPSQEFQEQIVNEIKSAYLRKKQKESEAQKLLDSIDPYLLNELGIILPEEDYVLEKRMFYISSSECVDKRIDPKKYSPKTKDLYRAIENSFFPNFPLASYVDDLCSGDWGSDGEVNIVPSGWTKCVVLRGTEFDNKYNLCISPKKVKQRLIQTDKFIKIQPLLNDIIIEKSGGSDDQPVGRVAIIDVEDYNGIPLSFSNFLMKIRVKGIDANYLYYYLKTIYNIGGTDSMQSQTNGIRNLIIKEYLEQKVVVPSLEKQQEISNHIAEMRLMAKRLQVEGESILENAKKEVEQMIIG